MYIFLEQSFPSAWKALILVYVNQIAIFFCNVSRVYDRRRWSYQKILQCITNMANYYIYISRDFCNNLKITGFILKLLNFYFKTAYICFTNVQAIFVKDYFIYK